MAITTQFTDSTGNSLECWNESGLVTFRTVDMNKEGQTVTLDKKHLEKLINLLIEYKEDMA